MSELFKFKSAKVQAQERVKAAQKYLETAQKNLAAIEAKDAQKALKLKAIQDAKVAKTQKPVVMPPGPVN